MRTLQKSMITEMLKRVWICRPVLLAALTHKDPEATNVVSCDVFRECIGTLNIQLQQMNIPQLTEIQIGAVCEIAAGGTNEVRYDEFLTSLHVEDMRADVTRDILLSETSRRSHASCQNS